MHGVGTAIQRLPSLPVEGDHDAPTPLNGVVVLECIGPAGRSWTGVRLFHLATGMSSRSMKKALDIIGIDDCDRLRNTDEDQEEPDNLMHEAHSCVGSLSEGWSTREHAVREMSLGERCGIVN